MEESFLGEIKYFAGSFMPKGWAACDGSFQSVTVNPQLFSVIGTTYGGDGVVSFALPDLRGRVVIGTGNGTLNGLGTKSGSEVVSLTSAMIPSHTHAANAKSPSDVGPATDPTGNFWAGNTKVPQFVAEADGDLNMNLLAIGGAGGGEPHPNMPPFQVVGFIICTSGTVPPRP